MSHLPIGATPDNPQYVSLEVGPATRVYHEASVETQIHSGPGILHSFCNTFSQDIKIWDHNGASPTDAGVLIELKLQPSTYEILSLRFTNGIRISTPTGKPIIIHYCPT